MKNQNPPKPNGFALVVSLSLMILLVVLSVGLLTLGSVTLRSSSNGEAMQTARANARFAVMMALGELQRYAGDDRRITADADISDGTPQPHLVGVWQSWSPSYTSNPLRSVNYATEKDSRFLKWLVSDPAPSKLTDRTWAASGPPADATPLFEQQSDGLDLRAGRVPCEGGGYAWAVSQENTKAKLNVASPQDKNADPNDQLQAQIRPSLALSESYQQPKSDWARRAARVLSMSQSQLDSDLVKGSSTVPNAADFTPYSMGLLTDAVKGGLKTDLSLGFGMSDSDFAKDKWGDTANPFRAAAVTDFTTPAGYEGQRPLYKPLINNAMVGVTTSFDPASVYHRFLAAGVPTFDTLRSHYRIPYYLYGNANQPTVYERTMDHAGITTLNAPGGVKPSPGDPPPGIETRTAIKPVLDRLVLLLSTSIGPDNEVRLNMTPIITLWNPYNVPLEIEGAVAYPWIDVPFNMDWTITKAVPVAGKPNPFTYQSSMSRMMGKQFEAIQGHGRSVDPYFFMQMTANGDGSTNTPIRFEAGEVRVFAPTSTTPVDFIRLGSNAVRTVKMRPVTDVSQMNTKGGLAVRMYGGSQGDGNGNRMVLAQGDKVKVKFNFLSGYNYFVTLEDSARIKNPADTTHGQVTGEVECVDFNNANNAVPSFSSIEATYTDLKNNPQPFGVLETYHRVAKSAAGIQPADLVYTCNPRQPYVTKYLVNGSFPTAPHYESALRAVASFNGAIQTTLDGRRSFYGPSNSSATGKEQLSFFEVPRAPMLSLAGFQQADLSSSAYTAANQFGNSWASAYLRRQVVAMNFTGKITGGLPIVDHSFLTNEALWDGYFFSGAAPTLSPGAAASGRSTLWTGGPVAREDRSLDQVVGDFVTDPQTHPLRNPRLQLHTGGVVASSLTKALTEPAGCRKIAGHLLVDGAFNVNSTSEEAWIALFAGLREGEFAVQGGTAPGGSETAFPRFRNPLGTANDNWNGFRTLDDSKIKTLARNLVDEVRRRGPFLSLGEFVNRRADTSDLGLSGAIQAAIDKSALNDDSKQGNFSTSLYPAEARTNIRTPDTGTGIPGYLTQADVLQSIAPVITSRSDTFVIRGYGEAKDAAGKVIARSWCEAVVQRMPEFVDTTDLPETQIADLKVVNKTFGRHFEIISLEYLPASHFSRKA